VRNDEAFERIKDEMRILRKVKRRNANWIGNFLRRNCLLQHVIEGKTEEMMEVKRR
jgi:hypothetical protein